MKKFVSDVNQFNGDLVFQLLKFLALIAHNVTENMITSGIKHEYPHPINY